MFRSEANLLHGLYDEVESLEEVVLQGSHYELIIRRSIWRLSSAQFRARCKNSSDPVSPESHRLAASTSQNHLDIA